MPMFTDTQWGVKSTPESRLESQLGKLGGVLRCPICGYEEPLTNTSMRLFSRRWPTHCGDQNKMVWVTEKDLKNETGEE